ncbi:Ycf66 family protein [Anabaena sp. CA = ATCC 33047]|uniref:Ycf66 family protein n=1 Tax=Anabaena sp. (strain CA / ATCC 33047) TaxID=52271 RepID=UPI000835ED28|nr:Ycf66 family protein [Anabaena sp. CA = ATCC 33047]
MLANVLALVVGLGSLAIYLSAFFFPEIHRKNDFIWSGVGLFYALVLWVFAPRITGGLLLGHVASVALLVWFGWQTLALRRQLTPQAQQTPLPSSEAVKTTLQEQAANLSLPQRLAQLQQSVAGIFAGLKNRGTQSVSPKTPTPQPETTPKPDVEIIDKRETPETRAQEPVTITESESPTVAAQPTEETATTVTEPEAATVPEVIPPHPPSPEAVEVAQADDKTEEKTRIPLEEIAPDAALAPPAEAPTEPQPPNNQGS